MDIIDDTFRVVRKDKSIGQYAFVESLIALPLSVLGIFVAVLFIHSMFFPEKETYFFIVAILSNQLWVIISIAILAAMAAPFLFYYHWLFRIACMYNTYNLLNGKESSFSYGLQNARGKVWRLLVLSIKSKVLTVRNSFRQSRQTIKTGKYPEGKLVMHSDTFAAPVMLFEDKNHEESIAESSRLYTDNFKKILKWKYKAGFLYGAVSFVVFVLVILIFVLFSSSIYLIIISLIIVSIIGSILGIMQSYADPVFLVVLYYHVKNGRMS